MRRIRHHYQLLFAAQPHEGLVIQLQHHFISTANDQERRSRDAIECSAGEIRATATGHHDAYDRWPFRPSDQSGRRPRAGSEETKRQCRCRRMNCRPINRRDYTTSQERNVKAELRRHLIDALFLLGQEIEHERRQVSVQQHLGNRPVTRAETAAAAAMRKDHKSPSVCRDIQVTVEHNAARVDAYGYCCQR
jgi:hypothetical protein